MKKINYKTSVTLLVVLASLVCILICLMVIRIFSPGEEAVVGIFSLAATLIGTIFIAIELKNNSEVTCSEMLINLNNYFHDSDRLMKVYEVLEKCNDEKDYTAGQWKDVSSAEVAQYCTFFENLFLLYRHHIASIDDLDDLFGYRFFSFVNNPYIQEKYIFPTSSSYAEIFELYKVWIKHRCQENNGAKGWQRHIPCSDYIIPYEYLDRKLYLYDYGIETYNKTLKVFEAKGKRFVMRQLGFDSISTIIRLQNKVVDYIEDKDTYYGLSRAEILESVQLDYVAGIFNEDDEMVAFAVIVNNRTGGRSLAVDFGLAPNKCFTFDAVCSDPEWRGFGFHRQFIKWTVELSESAGIGNILATVSPDNAPSRLNFLAEGFVVKDTKTKYSGLKRDLLLKCVAD
ncbi:MAG: hypothetical protein KBS67_06360 [Bacteroidales bacterium]|nr:hypothetical protein [Candidatus Cryptobacteroides equifaecalis]